MRKVLLALCIGAMVASSPSLMAAEEAQAATKPAPAQLTLEQQLFNDFATRLKDHFHKMAMLLDKISQSKDPQERQKLMKEYTQAMQTTHKVHQAMASLSGAGMSMGGKKMGGMMAGGMGCGMMKQRAGGAQSASAAADGQETAATSEGEEDEAKEASGHEGHH